MDKSKILSLRERFITAARNKTSLLLSPEEVATLYAIENADDSTELETPPQPVGDVNATVQFILSRIEPSNPFIIQQNGYNVPATWSLFLTWLDRWAMAGLWSFQSDRAICNHNGIKHVIFYTPHPELNLEL